VSNGRGHNGIASCIECLRTEVHTHELETDTKFKEFMRIGIGIGRPESRESREVSRYVLSDFLPNEMDLMRTRTFPEVIARLGRLVEEGV
jgi:peptidyl-tRNA hydrolase, PTH1 family